MITPIPLNSFDALVTLDTYIHSLPSLDDSHGFFAKPDWVKQPARPVQAWAVSGHGNKATVYLFEFDEPRRVGSSLQTGYALASAPWSIPYHWFGGDCDLPVALAAREVVGCGCA